MARPNFPHTGPFPGGNRGFGFGPRGFGPRGFGGFRACFLASCPFPPSFRPVSEQGGVDDFPVVVVSVSFLFGATRVSLEGFREGEEFVGVAGSHEVEGV